MKESEGHSMEESRKAIGVFDSGVGGIGTLAALVRELNRQGHFELTGPAYVKSRCPPNSRRRHRP